MTSSTNNNRYTYARYFQARSIVFDITCKLIRCIFDPLANFATSNGIHLRENNERIIKVGSGRVLERRWTTPAVNFSTLRNDRGGRSSVSGFQGRTSNTRGKEISVSLC